MEFAGLRYFNVFCPRQDLGGPYAAVIPTLVKMMFGGVPVTIFEDGEISRYLTYAITSRIGSAPSTPTRLSSNPPWKKVRLFGSSPIRSRMVAWRCLTW